jgi:hypothetical protein
VKGDPTPVCRYCHEHTPEDGHYVEALKAWVCYGCTVKHDPPSNRDFRAALASLRSVT